MIQRASRKNFETSLDSGLRTSSWPCFGNECNELELGSSR
jgi:hypothetical protein